MDKQINKIKKSLDKGEKDTKKLLKMDKKQDKKVASCDAKMTKKEEYAKVASREGRFSTLAKTEAKGAAERVKKEKGPAKADSRMEQRIDTAFAKKRRLIADKAKRMSK